MLQAIKKIKFRISNNKDANHDKPAYFDKTRLRVIAKVAVLVAIVVLAMDSVLKIVLPVRLYRPKMISVDTNPVSNRWSKENETEYKMEHPIRSGLFKPPRRNKTHSITDKTVETIFSSLKLQGVMLVGGQKVAYIVLKDGQMRKCKVGDNVKDMFTVLDIQSKSVSIDILGHKLSLTK